MRPKCDALRHIVPASMVAFCNGGVPGAESSEDLVDGVLTGARPA